MGQPDHRHGTGIYVLGMHRSGTSATTRVLNLLGVPVNAGGDEIPVDHKNPRGYWESRSLVGFNDELLATLGCSAWSPAALPQGWQHDPRLHALRDAAPAAFAAAFPTDQWLWKDPRNCLTFPFWSDVLGSPAGVVLVYRNPLEVAQSLARRDRYTTAHSLAMWERYVRSALAAASGLPALVVSYADLLADPLGWCEEALPFLRGCGLRAAPCDEEALFGFLEPGLRHAEFGADDLVEAHGVSASQRELYLALEQARGAHSAWCPPELPRETEWLDSALSVAADGPPADSAATAGAGRFAVLAFADELVRRPELVARLERRTRREDATLVVYAPGREPEEIAPSIERVLAESGAGPELDVLLLAVPAGRDELVAPVVDALLSLEPPRPPFDALPLIAAA